jgi:hypothetical protein
VEAVKADSCFFVYGVRDGADLYLILDAGLMKL